MTNVLQLCKKSPLPTKDGESLAVHQITKAFALHNFNVDVLSMLTPKHQEHSLQSDLNNVHYHTVYVDTTPTKLAALKNLASSLPYIIERFNSKAYAQKLIDLLQAKTYDYIILEGVFLGLYVEVIKQYSKAKLILRTHNVEHQIWERLAENESSWAKKAYFNCFMNKKLKIYENNIVKQMDALIPISPLDEQYFRQEVDINMLTVPVCFEQKKATTLPEHFSVAFLGGMDWLPNRNGVLWFIKEVWHPFIKKYPKASFHLAGRNFPKDIHDFKGEGIVIHGEIDDATTFIQEQRIMLVPLFSGSGMRVKIIEAMNLGRGVISSPIGAEGIDYTDHENIIIASTKKEWFTALEELYHAPKKVEEIARNAQRLVAQNYHVKKHADALINFMKSI